MNCERFFHHLNFFKSDRNSQIALFENFSTNEKFSFLLISCTRNRHSTVIEDYIRRDDVISRELDRLALTEIESRLHFFWNLSYRRKNLFLIRSVYAKTTFSVDRRLYKKRYCDLMRNWLSSFHRSLSRSVLSKDWSRDEIAIQSLKRREAERICLWSMIWLDRHLSFDRWTHRTDQ
jgi:hypothetical protein